MKPVLSSKWCSRGLVAVAFAAAACGGGGGGSGSTSTAGGNATISGNVTEASTAALRKASSPTLVARIVRFFSPITDAIAAPGGIRVLIQNLSSETDSNGSFVVNGAGAGTNTVTFEDNGQSYTLQVNVPNGSTVVLRDVALGADGEARPGQIDTYFRGTIGGASCATTPATLTVALTNQSVTVDLDENTMIKGTEAAPVSTCDDLASAVGSIVKVEAVTQSDGTLLAERVRVGSDDAIDPANEIGLRGAVASTSCPTSITVERGDGEPIVVTLSDATELEGVDGCEALADEHVKVRGTLEVDGSVTASQVSVETEGERSCEGRRSFPTE